MEYDDLQPHPKQRQFDLIFGLLFLIFGGYMLYNLVTGVPYSKIKILMGVFTFVLGVFKIYAYLKTKPLES